MKVTGKVIEVSAIESGTGTNGKEWKRQTVVIETLDQNPTQIAFDLNGEERINTNTCVVGDLVDVTAVVESRKNKDKWFTMARAMRIARWQRVSNDTEDNKPEVF